MAKREPFTQRMDSELYERVELALENTNRSKADAFDEMMRRWLARHESDRSALSLETLEENQKRILALLHDATEDAERTATTTDELTGQAEKNGRNERSEGTSTTIASWNRYEPSLPGRYTLAKSALREIPNVIDDGIEINPEHLDIDRYPKPVRVKKCLCVAAIRHVHSEPVTKTQIKTTIEQVLGTKRYADRYYSNVAELLYEWPLADDETEFYLTREALRRALIERLDNEEKIDIKDDAAALQCLLEEF